jgi:hypothetical protein
MANTSVYTGSDGSLTLSVPSGVEGDAAQAVISAYDTIAVGRVQDVNVKVLSEVFAFNEIGERYATQLRPGNVSITGTIGRAFINGAMLKLCLGEAADSRPQGSWSQPAMNMTLQVANTAVPDVRSIVTLHDVKIETWSLEMPESTFVLEAAAFKALFVSVQDEG